MPEIPNNKRFPDKKIIPFGFFEEDGVRLINGRIKCFL